MGKMNAMIAFFGMPSVFYTVAPNDVDNRLILALSLGRESVELELPRLSSRFDSLSKNAVSIS